jgi:protein O-mannosyl-transferase
MKYDNINIEKKKIGICILLILLIMSAYAQVREFDFLNYDDDKYVTANNKIQEGLTLKNISWALTAEVSGNWHPITLFTHMLDVSLFGFDAGKHHLTNLLFHIANSLLLFWIFNRISPALYQNAFIAALFAIHPLHVESVAWISERKDVLSMFFFMLTLWSYYRYIERPGVKRYLFILFFFILGLASKPMVVTIPFVLLLLDIWPLQRIQFIPNSRSVYSVPIVNLLVEKIPLFLLSTASCIITVSFQKGGEAVASMSRFPFTLRICNALVAYVKYLVKAFWPFDLAIFYPHPGLLPISMTAVSLVILILISFWAVMSIKNYPWFFTGWFWYAGTLVPVIGIVQVGSQAMADRYTYIPSIGIFIIISHGISILISKCTNRSAIAILSFSALIIFTAITWNQAGYFKNSTTLFRHALDITSDNAIAHNNYGEALVKNGMLRKAARHFREATRIDPYSDIAHNNIGNVLAKLGEENKAELHYRKAIQLNPEYADAYNNLGTLMYSKKKVREAIKCFQAAINLDPESYAARHNLNIAIKHVENKK